MLEEPEILILDEPTNHLDIDTRSIVEDVFEAYDGPILFISHDRYFINKVATKIITVKDTVSVFEGNYTEYIKSLEINTEYNKNNSQKKKRELIESNEKTIKNIVIKIENLEEKIVKLNKDLFKEDIYMNKAKYEQKAKEINLLENELVILYDKIDRLSV